MLTYSLSFIAILLLTAISNVFAVVFLTKSIRRFPRNIPVVGDLPGLGSPATPRKKFKDLLLDGYNQYRDHAFRISSKRKSHVVVSGKFIDEIRKAPDITLSLQENLNDTMMLRYTLGPCVADNPWHVGLVRKQLTHNLAAVFPAMYDEIKCAYEEEASISNNWTSIKAYDLHIRLVCRVSNRIFVGLPLCRNEEFLQISRDFTMRLIAAGYIIGRFPTYFRSLASRLFTTVPETVQRFQHFIVPVIEDRNRLAEEYGDDWADKPNDLLQWFIDSAEGEERDPMRITLRILTLNFAAIHTTSISFTHAMYYLAANSHFVQPLREEVDRVVSEQGWTKDAINSMHRIDSFLKESQRLTGVNAESMTRKVLKPFSFSDGVKLPVGSHVCVNLYGTHRDNAIYNAADVFDPFRFSKRVEAGEDPAKQLFATTSSEYLVWGHGSHSCPGRYFASLELKAMLAHVVLNYDVKFEKEGVRPPDHWMGSACVPDMKAEVMFRGRK